MTFLETLGSRVPTRIQEYGTTYAKRGFVRIDEDGPDRLAATVSGSRAYVTKIERRMGDLVWACDCVAFEDYGQCKHVWAVALVAAERSSAIVTGEVRPTPWKQRPAHPTVEKGLPPARLIYRLAPDRDPSCPKIAVAVEREELTPKGTYAHGRQLRIFGADDPEVAAQADRRIFAALNRVDFDHPACLRVPERVVLGRERFFAILPDLQETGRVAWVDRTGSARKAKVVANETWRLAIDLKEDPATHQFFFVVCLEGPRGSRRLMKTADLAAIGVACIEQRLVRLDNAGAVGFVNALFERFDVSPRGVEVDRAQIRQLLSDVAGTPHRLDLGLPPSLRHDTGVHSELEVLNSNSGIASPTAFQVAIRFVYGERPIGFEMASPIFEGPELRWVVRDRTFEAAAMARFASVGGAVTALGGEKPKAWLPVKAFTDAIAELKDAGWTVRAAGIRIRRLTSATTRISSGIDWFDLEIVADFEGVRPGTPQLLEAARTKSRTVMLDDGTCGMLPDDWLGRWGLLDIVGSTVGSALRFKKSQAWVLGALLDDLPDPRGDATFEGIRARLRLATAASPEPEPAGFSGCLRAYQREALGWFRWLRDLGAGGCLADDMGLGKTVEVLAMLLSRKLEGTASRPSLVVAPRSLIFNWMAEARRFVPGLRVADLGGTAAERATVDLGAIDLALTTYGVLRNDIETFSAIEFDYVILDEATAIKNSESLTARAARALRGTQRLALSGTPIENHLGELWSLFEFLSPGLLGRSSVFKNAAADDGGLGSDGDARALLGKALRPFILRRTKEQVAPELPEKTEQVLACTLEGSQRDAYDSLRAHYRSGLLGEARTQGMKTLSLRILEALLRLRQAACHPGLIDKTRTSETSAKLDVLVPRLEEILDGGHRALVFSSFVGFLDIVAARLTAQGIAFERLDGKTRNREERVARFQSEDGPGVFLISLKAGGVGLNLTAADYVFILDPWWNPAAEAQAADRAHRIGQTRRVVVYRLVAADTIEEKILALQGRKSALVDSILDSGATSLSDLDADDLGLLLG